MKLKERLLHTDLILLTGLFLGMLKTFNSLSAFLLLPEGLDSLLTLGMCGCYGLHVLLRRPGLLRLAGYGAAALIGAYSALRSGDMSGMITLLTCIALADCDFESVMKHLFRWNLAFFLFNTVCSVVMGLIQGPLGPLTHLYHNNTIVVHLGYGHKNIMSMHMISVTFLWIWQYFRKIKIRDILLVLAATTVFLLLNQCKTAYLVYLWICVMMFWFLRSKKETYPLVQVGAVWGPAALFAFSVVCVFLFRQGNPLAIWISDLLTGRIALCATAMDQYGLTFFGHLASEIAQVENRILYMDNAYLYGMVQIGLLWPIAFCASFFLLARRSKDVRVHFGILLWALYSMTEITPLNGLMFAPALLPSLLLSPRKQIPS